MKEQLITFDTAKLAKEKEFDIPVLYAFDDEDGFLTSSYVKDVFHPINYNSSSYKCSKPTQSLLQKWLREKHEIDCTPIYGGKDNMGMLYICKVGQFKEGYSTYEEALEKCLEEALKLIK